MAYESLPILKQRFFDDNGNPLSGGKLWSYIAGTSSVTPSGTFGDVLGSSSNTNPVILDGNGEANVYMLVGGGAYKFVLTDANDVVKWTVDNINVSSADTPSGWTSYAVTDGQAATILTDQTINFTTHTSVIMDVEIKRGTTVISNLTLAIQTLNGTGRLIVGPTLDSEAHGVTFSITQASTVAQLLAALDSGAGNGSIKISRRLIAV